MNPMRLLWITAALLAAASLALAAAISGAAAEILLGVAGPTAAALGSLALMEQASRRGPDRLTRLLLRAFVVKLVLIGAYVTAGVTLLALDPVWFAGSFAVAFIVLHAAEAAHLHRLSAG